MVYSKQKRSQNIKKRQIFDVLFKLIVTMFSFVGIVALILMFSFILKEAFPAFEKYGIINLYFSADYSDGKYGMLGALSLTLISSILATLIALPIAIRCALFVHFRLKTGKKVFKTIIHVLAGVPSILFGIFAFYSLSKLTNFAFNLSSGQTLINGIIMLTFMILPTLITMILNQLKILPKNFINAALALGNSKTHAMYTIVKKEIKSGIMIAVIIALGRAIGETMALSLLLTSIPGQNVFSEGFTSVFINNTMTLGVVIAKTFFDDVGASKSHLFAAGVLLFVIVMSLILLINKISQKRKFELVNPNVRISKLIKNKNNFQNNLKLVWFILIYPFSITNLMFHNLLDQINRVFYYVTLPIYKLIYPKQNLPRSKYFVEVIKRKSNKIIDIFRIILESIFVLIVIGFAFWLIFDILYNGIPTWTVNDWKYSYTSNETGFKINKPGSIGNPLLFTVTLIGVVILISFPISLFIAIYLSEYGRNKRHTKVIKFFLDSLGGTPSIIFGIFGSIFFIKTLNLRIGKVPYSLIAGALTMTLVVIPTFTRSIEQTILKVPDSYRKASYALGSSKLKTIFKIIIPQSISGIIVGIILTSGRVIAETAPVYLTFGGILTAGEIDWFSPGHTLTTEILGMFWTNPDFNYHKEIGYKLGSVAILLTTIISLFADSIEPIIRKKPVKKITNFIKIKVMRKSYE